MAWLGDRVRYRERHFDRLAEGCERLGLETPDGGELDAEIARLGLPDTPCVLKLILTRGVGGRGYAPPEAAAPPQRLWLTRPWPEIDASVYQAGVRVAWLTTTLSRQPRLAGIKHLNRLEQVLGAREVADLDADDGLLCDEFGHVIEAVAANLFCVRDGALHTPLLDYCGVRGVMREVLIETAASVDVAVHEWPLRRADVALSDEVFLCNSIRGIVPVCAVGALRFDDFPMARRLTEALSADGVRTCG
jgi:4-amino-4-deoxychorismate lyase